MARPSSKIQFAVLPDELRENGKYAGVGVTQRLAGAVDVLVAERYRGNARRGARVEHQLFLRQLGDAIDGGGRRGIVFSRGACRQRTATHRTLRVEASILHRRGGPSARKHPAMLHTAPRPFAVNRPRTAHHYPADLRPALQKLLGQRRRHRHVVPAIRLHVIHRLAGARRSSEVENRVYSRPDRLVGHGVLCVRDTDVKPAPEVMRRRRGVGVRPVDLRVKIIHDDDILTGGSELPRRGCTDEASSA